MSNAPSQQMGGRGGQVKIPRISMQAIDMQMQQAVIGPISMPPTHPQPSSPHLRQQPKSPRTQQQHQQALHRSMSVSPGGQFVGTHHNMSSPQQAHIVPPTLQEGRRPSPTKRASFDPQLEHDASPPLQEQRQPSPTKRKTIIVNPTSFDIAPRSQMVPSQQEMVSPRKSMTQQVQPSSPRQSMMLMPQPQPLSPRKSTMMMPQSQQPLSPRKSMMQQPAQPLSPTKLMRQQSPVLQGHAVRSFSMYPEHSTPSSQQENLPASGSYMNQRSMSISPAAHRTRLDDEGEEEDDDDSYARPINRSTSMVPTASSSVRFQENQSVLTPSTSHNYAINRSASFSPEARQQQVNQPVKLQANINARMSISPRRTQKQQQPSSPARLQSGINRSMSISPTQMNMEQQPQPRLSSVNLAAVQGVRPGSPPQLNRYLSTAAPRVSVVTPTRASSTFQPQQLHSASSSKQMQPGRMSVEHGAASSFGRRLMNHEHHLSITDVVLRSLAAIASAVAFCVMITNTVWINGQTISYSNIAGFRYVAGISATAFIISISQLGIIASKKLRSRTLGVEVRPTRPCLFSSMFVDQLFAYLLLSAGSVGVGALVYIPSICKRATQNSAEFCSRSTLSVVLTLVVSIIFVMSAILSTFKFYKKSIGPI